MAHRRKNLLDAFRASHPSKSAPGRGEAGSVSGGGAGTTPAGAPTPRVAPARVEPLASAHPTQGPLPARVTPPTPPPSSAPRPGTHADVAPPPAPISGQRVVLLALLATTIALLAYLVLRPSTDASIEAADRGGANATPASTPPVAPGATPNAGGSAAPVANAAPTNPLLDPNAGYSDFDRAFFDKKNRFTVRVAQYQNTPDGTRLAQEAYRYLKNEGVRVVQPIRSGDGRALYLCAFAEAKKDDIDAWCEQVKKLRGPSGTKYPFSTAYVDNIDHVVLR